MNIPTITTLCLGEGMSTPHPRLVPLLEAAGLDWAAFCKRGRPPEGLRQKRAGIITALHEAGCTWAEMIAITGLSNGSIQRLTLAKGCAAVKTRKQDLGRRVGKTAKGRRCAWLSQRLRQLWAEGKFDFHRGSVRSAAVKAKMKASWTMARRQSAALGAKMHVWGDPKVRAKLLAFHRSPQERARQSQAQAQRMRDTPARYLRGRAAWIPATKEPRGRIYVRSAYEVAAVARLEADPKVAAYEYERCLPLPGGRWVLPDFIVTPVKGRQILIEVKAAWVFGLPPSHKVQQRLQAAEQWANAHGLGFLVWTEKDLGLSHAHKSATD